MPELVPVWAFEIPVARSTGVTGWRAEGLVNDAAHLRSVRMNPCAVGGADTREMDAMATKSFVAKRV